MSLTLVRDHQSWLTAHDIAVLPKSFRLDDLLAVLKWLDGTAATPPTPLGHRTGSCLLAASTP